MDWGTLNGTHLALPFDPPSPAYVLGRDGHWALVWMPRRDQLLWVDLELIPFESLERQDGEGST
jgi:hypothetical protein